MTNVIDCCWSGRGGKRMGLEMECVECGRVRFRGEGGD